MASCSSNVAVQPSATPTGQIVASSTTPASPSPSPTLAAATPSSRTATAPAATPTPASRTQRQETPLPKAREEAAAAAAGGSLYVIGGFDPAGHSLDSVVVLQGGGAWRAGPKLTVAVDHPSAATLDDVM